MAEFSTAWMQTLENKGTEEGGIWGRKGKSERERAWEKKLWRPRLNIWMLRFKNLLKCSYISIYTKYLWHRNGCLVHLFPLNSMQHSDRCQISMLRQLSVLLQSVETQKNNCCMQASTARKFKRYAISSIGHVPASTSIVCPGTTFSLNSHSYNTIPTQTLTLIDKNIVQAPNLSPMHKP